MSSEHRHLTTLKFEGPRFEGHGLDIDVLPELIIYKQVLVEMAKELWSRAHPDRERAPRGFEESISLEFFEFAGGSTAVPIMRKMAQPQLSFDLDELEQSVDLIDEGIGAIGSDRPLPEALPKFVLRRAQEMGRTLAQDESMLLMSPRRPAPVRLTREVRDRIAAVTERGYEDVVDLTGEVRQTDLDGSSFALRLESGLKVTGKFRPEHETLVTDALRDHESRRVRVKGRAAFSHDDGTIRRFTEIEELGVVSAGPAEYDPHSRPIWEVVAEMGSAVPDEEWSRIPSDLASNLEKYLRGHESRG